MIGAGLGPLAVIAGAGSGKSETMAARLVWLVGNGMVRADRVLGLTFTRKAAAELADRVRSRLDRLYRAGLADVQADAEAEPVISTYHAYAGRLVSDHALREGLEPSMRLITPALSWQLAATIVAAYDGPMDAVQWTPQTVTAAVLQLTGDLAEHLRAPGEVRAVGQWLARQQAALPGRSSAAVRRVLETQRAREQLLPLVERYQAAKQAREVLDHGDQVELAARIAARHPEVGAAERGRYHVVLLDEYQDTSHAQLVLLRALFGGGHPVTAVGDPCQSIYGWRGASAGNLRRFAHDFPAKAGERTPVRLLSTSFRNTGRVLDAAARLQAELRAEAPDVPLLVPAPGRSDRGRVTAALLPTAIDEADWVGDQAAALLALPIGSAPDGRPWPDAQGLPRRPPVRHRHPVQEAVAVRGAPPGPRGALDPVRGGRPRRAALGPRGAGRGGHAAGAARRGRVGRAGPAADRTALADRPARPGGARPPRQGPGHGEPRPRRAARTGQRRAAPSAPAPAAGLMIRRAPAAPGRPRRRPPINDALSGADRPHRRDRFAGRGAGRPRRPGRLLADRLRPAERAGERGPVPARARVAAAGRPHRRGRAGAEPGYRGGRAAGRRSGHRAGRPGRVHRRGGDVRGRSAGADAGRVPGLSGGRPAGGVRPGDGAGRRVGHGQAAHRARRQGAAVAGRLRPRAGRRATGRRSSRPGRECRPAGPTTRG